MAEISILEAGPVFDVPAGEAVKRGDLLYYSQTNSDYRKADNDAAAESGIFPFAEFVALSSAAADGDDVLVSKSAVLYDTADNSFATTVGATLYLGDTAGTTTSTRPTGANDVKQVVGHAYGRVGGTGAQVAVINLGRCDHTINLSPMTDGTAVYSQRNDYTGVLLAAASEAAGYTFMVPENATGRLVIAYLWWSGVGTALDTNDPYTIDVSAGIDDETNTATTDGITAAALTVAADDLNRATVTAAFDTGIIEPGNVVGVDVDKADEGAGGDDPLMLCCVVVLEVAA